MESENKNEKKTYTKEEALRVLGLPENADDSAVKQRYGALLRSYKHRIDENGATYEDIAYYEDISLAYDTILGYTHDFGDDNPSSPVPYKIRKKWGKFLTVLEQYWLAYLIVAVILFLGINFAVQKFKEKEDDLIVKFVGAFAEDPTRMLPKEMDEKSAEFDNMQVTFFTVTTSTTMLDYGSRTQAENFQAQLMSPGQLDVVLMDKESFDAYVGRGVFKPLDEYFDKYAETHKDKTLPVAFSFESEPDENGTKRVKSGIYGIDVTDTAFFDGMGLGWKYDEAAGQEKSLIFTIAGNTKRPERAYAFLEELLEVTYENTAD